MGQIVTLGEEIVPQFLGSLQTTVCGALKGCGSLKTISYYEMPKGALHFKQ